MSAPGSHRAFEDIYRTEHRRLLQFFKRKVGADHAPDLVQEAFARVWQNGEFHRLDNPQGYLIRTAQNMLIDLARKRQRNDCTFCLLDEARDAPMPPEQEWGIQALELRAAYRRALLALPRRTRRIFWMHRLKGMSYRQIANQFGIGEPGVEYHMMRALSSLRRAMVKTH